MHGIIWKLSAVASVIGIGLLAVVLQNRFGGKTMSLEAAATSGAETAGADDTTSPTSEDDSLAPGVPTPPPPGGHSEKGPDDGGSKLTTAPRNAPNRIETGNRSSREEDDEAAFPGKRTGHRTPASANEAPTDDFKLNPETNEDGPAPPMPSNSNPRGRRTAQAASKPDLVDKEDGEQSEQSLAIRKPKETEELEMGDPLDRTKNRNGRGRPNSRAEPEETEAEQPTQSLITSAAGDSTFNEETQPTRPPGPRTGSRSGVGSTSAKPNPHKSFINDGYDSQEPGAKHDSQIEHQNLRGGPITARGQSEMSPEDTSSRTNRRGNQQPEEMPESDGTIVPPVAPARSRPNSLVEDDTANDRPTARRNRTQPRAIPQADRPAQKQEPLVTEEPGAQEASPAVPPPTPRNNRRRSAALSEEDDGGAQSPPAVPVARPRAADETDPAGEAGPAVPSRQRNLTQEENPNDFGAGNPPDSTNPNPASIESPAPPGRNPNMNNGYQPDEKADRPEAAASGSTATDVIAPRPPDIAPAMPGAARGRARVTIEKVAPPTAVLGQPLIYNIIIRNSGNASAKQVVVEDDIPTSVTVQGSIPQAEMTGQKLKWKIGKLDVGEEQKISVKVIPTAEGPVGSAATVNFVHDQRQIASGPDNAADAPVSLELQYPPQVTLGQPFEVKFRLTNRTNAPLSNLNILHQLPSGLQHESGKPNLEFKVKLLGAGERLEVPLHLNGVQSGNAISRSVVITADETVLVSKVFNQDVRQNR